MKAEFWHERWEAGQIGFHQDRINDYLRRHWHHLDAAPGERVFVPLCGKSKDMLWLRDHGHGVFGVELSPLAVDAFFTENDITASESQNGAFTCKTGKGIELWCGDFFNLRPEHLAGTKAVYDRASLIALPPEMRHDYASHLASLLEPGCRVLLITMEYPQHEMSGPPFAVEQTEVESLYKGAFDVRVLGITNVLEDNPRFRERGITRMEEKSYLLTRR